MGEERNAYRAWWGNLKETGQLEDLGTDRRIRLKQILKKESERTHSNLFGLESVPTTGCCKPSNNILGSTKRR
jgi:hypothetical protein